MNRRVVGETNGTAMEYSFDSAGLRTSSWLSTTNAAVSAEIYWGKTPIAYRSNNGRTFFEHLNWQGTERLRTDYQGNVAETTFSYPFGDGYSENVIESASNQDNLHFALLDHDSESGTDHAQFRQYSAAQGRWMSPTPTTAATV